MNGKFDKLAPGLTAKLNLLFDLTLVLVMVPLATHPEQLILNTRLLTLSAAGVSIWLFAAALLRLYSPWTPRSSADNVFLGLLATAGLTISLVLLDRFLTQEYPRLDAIAFSLSFFGCSTLARLALFQRLQQIDGPLDDVLIIGTGALGVATYERMRANTGEKRRVVGFLNLPGERDKLPGIDVPVFGSAEDLNEILFKHPVAEVYVAGRILSHGEEMQKIVTLCERIGVPFALPLHSLIFERAQLLSSSKARDGYLHYLSTTTRPGEYAIKRLIDIAASSVGLVMLSPLLAAVIAAIKVSSKGPVLFRQTRVGLHGAEFNLLKFRSMVVDAEDLKAKLMKQNEQTGPVFKMRNDPRITSVGRFIRKYSIDELPQLVNVLRGDMSLVGPRPALPKEVEQYKLWQRRRLSVRPGLTCYWQVGGRNEIGFDEWMRMDLRYIDDWSLATDVRLILQTFPVVLAGRGAS
ncbi:MAG: sugar transferase [Myxococcota bacterium]